MKIKRTVRFNACTITGPGSNARCAAVYMDNIRHMFFKQDTRSSLYPSRLHVNGKYWWNFHHYWLHWKLSKWQPVVQPLIAISSKRRYYNFRVHIAIHFTWIRESCYPIIFNSESVVTNVEINHTFLKLGVVYFVGNGCLRTYINKKQFIHIWAYIAKARNTFSVHPTTRWSEL